MKIVSGVRRIRLGDAPKLESCPKPDPLWPGPPVQQNFTGDLLQVIWFLTCVALYLPLYLLASIALALALYLRCAKLMVQAE